MGLDAMIFIFWMLSFKPGFSLSSFIRRLFSFSLLSAIRVVSSAYLRLLAIWSLVPLPFLNPAWTFGSSQFTYCWSLTWRILSYLGRWVQLYGSLNILWYCPSLGLEWKLTSLVLCRIFQICKHIECSTFTASSFRIWNSSTGIPSPPLALLVVMLPKAHLTSHSMRNPWTVTYTIFP